MLRQSGKPFLHCPGSLDRIELFGREPSAAPLHELLATFMFRIGQSVEELRIAPGPANIFRRTGSLSLQTERVFLVLLDRRAALEQDLMFPAVTEVVFVLEGESLAALRYDFADHRVRRIDAHEILEAFVQEFGIAVNVALDLELV